MAQWPRQSAPHLAGTCVDFVCSKKLHQQKGYSRFFLINRDETGEIAEILIPAFVVSIHDVWRHGVPKNVVRVAMVRLGSLFSLVFAQNDSALAHTLSLFYPGKCATQQTCPKGFNRENGLLVPYNHGALLKEKSSGAWHICKSIRMRVTCFNTNRDLTPTFCLSMVGFKQGRQVMERSASVSQQE